MDFDHTYYNPSSDRTHLCIIPWYRDRVWADLEPYGKTGKSITIWLPGIAGRWSHVFRPAVNDDPIWYFQRMSRDSSKGIIITKHFKTGPTYYLISKPIDHTSGETYYYGGPWNM